MSEGWVCLGDGYVQEVVMSGVGMSKRGRVSRHGTWEGGGYPPSLGHGTWDTRGYGWQMGSTYPTGMLSCFFLLVD